MKHLLRHRVVFSSNWLLPVQTYHNGCWHFKRNDYVPLQTGFNNNHAIWDKQPWCYSISVMPTCISSIKISHLSAVRLFFFKNCLSLVWQSRILSALWTKTHVGHVLIESKSFVNDYKNLHTKHLRLYHLVKQGHFGGHSVINV